MKGYQMGQSGLSPRLIAGIIIALLFGIALCLRIALPYNEVFGSDGIKFTGVDTYYFVRQVDNPAPEITSLQAFPSYKEAEAYVLRQESENYKIVGTNPFVSPVPLKALEHYKLIYSSDSCVGQPGAGTIPEVKIFEYNQ